MAPVHQSSQDSMKQFQNQISTGEYSSLSYELVVSYKIFIQEAEMFCVSLSGCIWYHSAVDDVSSCQTYQMAVAQLLTLQCPVIQVSSNQAQLLQFFEHAFSLNHDQCQISPHNANSVLRTQVKRIWRDISLMCHQIQNKI